MVVVLDGTLRDFELFLLDISGLWLPPLPRELSLSLLVVIVLTEKEFNLPGMEPERTLLFWEELCIPLKNSPRFDPKEKNTLEALKWLHLWGIYAYDKCKLQTWEQIDLAPGEA